MPKRSPTTHRQKKISGNKSALTNHTWIKVLIAIAACQLVGIIGSLFTAASLDTWYAALAKPGFQPPSWLFGPVWLALYTMMGMAGYLIWSQKNKKKTVRPALAIFAFHLVVNALWSIVFFGWQNVLLALFVIGLLLSLVIILFRRFQQIKPAAAYLLIPYLAWLLFAMALNFEVWRLN